LDSVFFAANRRINVPVCSKKLKLNLTETNHIIIKTGARKVISCAFFNNIKP
jgi:hypothetical protein